MAAAEIIATVEPPPEMHAKTTDIVTVANGLRVANNDEYIAAGETLKALAEIRKGIEAFWAEPIARAHEAHKLLCKRRSEMLDRLAGAEKQVRYRLADYAAECERRRIEEQRRLDAIAAEERRREEAAARKAEEDRVLAEAAELESRGDKDAAERMLSEPIATPPAAFTPSPIAVSEAPRLAGVASRQNWTAEVVNLRELVAAVAAGKVPILALAPNEQWLRGQARLMKDQLNIPGVRAVNRASVAVTSGGARRADFGLGVSEEDLS